MKKFFFKLPIIKQYLNLKYQIANIESHLEIIHLNIDQVKISENCSLNGQNIRKNLIKILNSKINFKFFVETGTFLGMTASYIARNYPSIEVITCEHNSFNYKISNNNLISYNNLKLLKSKSIYLLEKIIDSNGNLDSNFLFYLDAHWGTDNPLRDEIKIILNNFKNYVIIIDDFKVPRDPGYGWDTGITTDDDNRIENISGLLSEYGSNVYWPKMNSSDETGAKRGSVILGSSSMDSVLCKIDVLEKMAC